MAVHEHRSADAGLRVETRLAVLGRPHGPGQPLNAPIVPASKLPGRAGWGGRPGVLPG
jgi:cystathionine gamma-synthase